MFLDFSPALLLLLKLLVLGVFFRGESLDSFIEGALFGSLLRLLYLWLRLALLLQMLLCGFVEIVAPLVH
jgi:hypothetical protein